MIAGVGTSSPRLDHAAPPARPGTARYVVAPAATHSAGQVGRARRLGHCRWSREMGRGRSTGPSGWSRRAWSTLRKSPASGMTSKSSTGTRVSTHLLSTRVHGRRPPRTCRRRADGSVLDQRRHLRLADLLQRHDVRASGGRHPLPQEQRGAIREAAIGRTRGRRAVQRCSGSPPSDRRPGTLPGAAHCGHGSVRASLPSPCRRRRRTSAARRRQTIGHRAAARAAARRARPRGALARAGSDARTSTPHAARRPARSRYAPATRRGRRLRSPPSRAPADRRADEALASGRSAVQRRASHHPTRGSANGAAIAVIVRRAARATALACAPDAPQAEQRAARPAGRTPSARRRRAASARTPRRRSRPRMRGARFPSRRSSQGAEQRRPPGHRRWRPSRSKAPGPDSNQRPIG